MTDLLQRVRALCSTGRQKRGDFQSFLVLPLCYAVPPAGTLLFLSLALFIFTRETHRCLPQLTQSHGVLMVMLKTLLSPRFLACLAQT